MIAIQTLLITLLVIVARCHTMFGTSLINRPIVLGAMTGLIMGNFTQGVIMGHMLALFQLVLIYHLIWFQEQF